MGNSGKEDHGKRKDQIIEAAVPGADRHFMEKALEEARAAFEEGEIPIGAVVVCDNKVIAKDHNRVERLNDATAHAEMLALTAAQNYLGSKYLDQCTLYTTLEPCSMCAGGLFWTQMQKVIFGASDRERGFTCYDKKIIHPKTSVVRGVEAEACEILIREFFNKMRGN